MKVNGHESERPWKWPEIKKNTTRDLVEWKSVQRFRNQVWNQPVTTDRLQVDLTSSTKLIIWICVIVEINIFIITMVVNRTFEKEQLEHGVMRKYGLFRKHDLSEI